MDFRRPQEGSSSLRMPVPMSYGSLHESAKLRMMAGSGPSNGTGTNINREEQQQSTNTNTNTNPNNSMNTNIGNQNTRNVQQSSELQGGGGSSSNTNTVGAAAVTAGGAAAVATKSSKGIRYRECLKNHAASIGGHALDGCGEFMASGEEGTLEALKCAACGCHRNFHRREVEGEAAASSSTCYFCAAGGAKALDAHHLHLQQRRYGGVGGAPNTPLALPPPPGLGGHHTPPPPAARALQPPPLGFSSASPTECDDPDFLLQAAAVAGHGHPGMAGHQYHHHQFSSSHSMKKRFRTKFTSEQKEQMYAFAEKLGWRIQKHDEAAVHQFCADVGVKRHVFKVWMHNNKSSFAKKISPNEVGSGYLDNGAASSPTTSSGMQP